MKPRLAIFGVVVLILVLALRERLVAPRGAGGDTPKSAPAAANPPPRLPPLMARTPSATVALERSRFAAELAALPVEADTDDWKPTLDRLADSVPILELGVAVRELTGASPDGPHAMLRERLLVRWTQADPEAAAAWAAGLTGADWRSEALLQVAVGWASSDWPAAVAWAGSVSDDHARHGLLLQLAHESLREDPLRALELTVDLPADRSRDELVAQAVGSWALRDPQDASRWARSISDEEERVRALESVVVNWAVTDPIAAAQLALENLPSGQAFNRAVVAVVQRWARSDPRAAAEWIERFERGALQSAATDNLVTNWFADDARGPAGWLESLPPGALRDYSIASYARQLASIDERTLATRWLNQVSNNDLRLRTEESIAAFTAGSTRN